MLPFVLLCVSWLHLGPGIDAQTPAVCQGRLERAPPEPMVELQIVVLADGSVGAIRVLKSLDDQDGLDRQAIEAAARWLFEPATLNGTAVAAKATLELEFRLR
jgi:protein TonB